MPSTFSRSCAVSLSVTAAVLGLAASVLQVRGDLVR
jgi:hypothetical protein